MKKNKDKVFNTYVALAKKLGKLPSSRECVRFGLSKDAIDYNFETLSKLRKEILDKHPELEYLKVPSKLTFNDIENHRIDVLTSNVKSSNKGLVSKLSALDYIAQFSEKVFKGKIAKTKVPKTKKPTSRILNLVLSDLHFGADVSKEETGVLDYKISQEARRLAHIVKETVEYKKQHRDETELRLILLGDIIQNQLHDARDAAPLAEQFCRAVHLLSQAVGYLSQHFKKVVVECQSGNHGRLTTRHHNRAVNQKWDSIETMIYYAVKNACSNVTNVVFNIPKTPYSIYSVFDQKIMLTHGDTVLKISYPGHSVNIKALENQVNKLNASLNDKDEIKVVVAGHVHFATTSYLANGGVLITNSSLIPVDEYAVSLGSLESNTGQMLFESVPGFAMGDSRFIRVGKEQDEDETLENIIKPWPGL